MEKHILIVEDEVKISRFLQLELQYEGYKVSQSYDGRDGLEKALSLNPDLIILDIMLPSMNGIEVCRRIRRQSSVPIIMLTAKDTTMDIVMGLDIGANDYVTKPFAIEVEYVRGDISEEKFNMRYKHLLPDKIFLENKFSEMFTAPFMKDV